jgi:hypothetical protein
MTEQTAHVRCMYVTNLMSACPINVFFRVLLSTVRQLIPIWVKMAKNPVQVRWDEAFISKILSHALD